MIGLQTWYQAIKTFTFTFINAVHKRVTAVIKENRALFLFSSLSSTIRKNREVIVTLLVWISANYCINIPSNSLWPRIVAVDKARLTWFGLIFCVVSKPVTSWLACLISVCLISPGCLVVSPGQRHEQLIKNCRTRANVGAMQAQQRAPLDRHWPDVRSWCRGQIDLRCSHRSLASLPRHVQEIAMPKR